MASTAEKLDPELWEEAKADAREKFGGHSARAMQYAVKLYKERGGRYKGPKKKDNRLTQWTEQDWTTKSGRPSKETGERYLPKDAIAALTPAEYGATTRAKRRGGGVGSVVAQPQSIREKTQKFRKVNPDMATAKQIAARKKFAERARSGELARMRKKSTRKKNPAATVSDEISAQMRKGKPQKQAVAIALEMERAGKLKKNPVIPSPLFDYELIAEIKLAALNDADLYRQQGKPIIDNLAKKMVKGTFDAEKAVKLYQYLADNAVKKYSVEQMGARSPTLTILSKPEREILAQHLFEAFAEEIQDTAEQMRSRKRNPTATRAPARKRTQLVSNGERKKNPVVKTFPAYADFRFKVETSKDGVKFMNPVGFPRKINAINYAKMLAEKNPDLFIRVYELTAADLSYAV